MNANKPLYMIYTPGTETLQVFCSLKEFFSVSPPSSYDVIRHRRSWLQHDAYRFSTNIPNESYVIGPRYKVHDKDFQIMITGKSIGDESADIAMQREISEEVGLQIYPDLLTYRKGTFYTYPIEEALPIVERPPTIKENLRMPGTRVGCIIYGKFENVVKKVLSVQNVLGSDNINGIVIVPIIIIKLMLLISFNHEIESVDDLMKIMYKYDGLTIKQLIGVFKKLARN